MKVFFRHLSHGGHANRNAGRCRISEIHPRQVDPARVCLSLSQARRLEIPLGEGRLHAAVGNAQWILGFHPIEHGVAQHDLPRLENGGVVTYVLRILLATAQLYGDQ